MLKYSTLCILVNLAIYNFLYESFLFKIIYVAIALNLIWILVESLKNKYKAFSQEKIEKEKAESKAKESELKNLYKDNFEKSDNSEIFDQKIFPLIDLLNELTDESLHGVFKLRVKELINKSLTVYTFNIKHAIKMNKASSAGLDLTTDIQEVVKQNIIVKDSLKDFVMKLIMLEENSEEFNALIKTFESSLKTLNIIKESRKEF